MKERLQKVLARSGQGSRRRVESMITDGSIAVNGEVATLGLRVGLGDRVSISGQRYRVVGAPATMPKVLAYHKPEGEICTRRDEAGRPTVYAALPKLGKGRWISVGRLDINTSGLLLFSDDGEFVNRLTHPSAEVEREYAVRVRGEPGEADLARLTEGVQVAGDVLRCKSVTFGGGTGRNRWYHMILTEGRNREIRRLWEAVGCTVSRLIRVRFGSQLLPRSLRPGKHRLLRDGEVAELKALSGFKTNDKESTLELQRERPRRRR